MINVTVRNIIESVPIFRRITSETFNMGAAYKIARLIRELDNEYELFEKARADLINKYGEKDEEGNLKEQDGKVSLKPDCIKDFNEAVQDILNNKVEINAEPIEIEYLSEIKISPTDIILIMPFIKEKDPA